MISKALNTALGVAVTEAKKWRHEYLSTEHILYAILQDEEGCGIIANCGGNIGNLSVALESYFETQLESIPEVDIYELQQTVGFQRVLQ